MGATFANQTIYGKKFKEFMREKIYRPFVSSSFSASTPSLVHHRKYFTFKTKLVFSNVKTFPTLGDTVYLAGTIAEVLHDLLGGGLLGNSQHHQRPPDLLHQLGVCAAWKRGEGRQPGLKYGNLLNHW